MSERTKERILELEKLLQQEAEAREAAEHRAKSAQEELEKLRPKEAHGPSWASRSGEDEYGYWVEFTLSSIVKDRPVVQRLRRIEAGSFRRGSPRYPDESPQRKVEISRPFWLFDTPCTQALWEAVMGENPSHFSAPDRPVERVSWDRVQEFLKRINAQVRGLELRLPSEAEWEYACRAGTISSFSWGDEDPTSEQAAFRADQTSEVRSHPPNPWGLYDMHGNVREWCSDHWHKSYDGAPSDGRIWVDENAGPRAQRVIRGGCWLSQANHLRSAYRDMRAQDFSDDTLGFRCAQSSPCPTPKG